MEQIEKELNEYGLSIRYNDAKDSLPVDFSIEDKEDNLAWVWGDRPSDVDWECNHPEECWEFGDDDEYGECKLCGSHCSWTWRRDVVDEGHDEDGNYTCQVGDVREVTEWFGRKTVGGIIEKILKELEANNGKKM